MVNTKTLIRDPTVLDQPHKKRIIYIYHKRERALFSEDKDQGCSTSFISCIRSQRRMKEARTS